eukprot:scaffold22865_cov92-Isochrysis_galbana.AAC.3
MARGNKRVAVRGILQSQRGSPDCPRPLPSSRISFGFCGQPAGPKPKGGRVTSYAAMDSESESESQDADLAPSDSGPPTICPGGALPGGRCVGCSDAASTAAACSAKSDFSPGLGVEGGENLPGGKGRDLLGCRRMAGASAKEENAWRGWAARDRWEPRAPPVWRAHVGEGDEGVGGSAVSRQTRCVVSLRPSAAARTSISSSAAESAVTVSEPSRWLRWRLGERGGLHVGEGERGVGGRLPSARAPACMAPRSCPPSSQEKEDAAPLDEVLGPAPPQTGERRGGCISTDGCEN